jgi:hypothetical protein
LWAKTYERDLRDVLAPQGDVAQAIAREIQIKLTPQEQSWLTSKRPSTRKRMRRISRATISETREQRPGLGKASGISNRRLTKTPVMPQRTSDWLMPITSSGGILYFHPKRLFPKPKQQPPYGEAIGEFQKARVAGGCPCELAGLGYTYVVAGKRAEAEGILRQMKALSQQTYPFSYLIAEAYTGLGDKDSAFKWLDRAYKERDGQLSWLGLDPFVDSLRSDPRFQDLVRRVGLPP